MMFKTTNPVKMIASKDISDAMRDHFIIIITLFLVIASLTALITGAIALSTGVATYNAAKETLLALGKSANAIAAPEFYPLGLLRGAVEQIEIVGAVIAMLIGYRAAASERGRQTLALIMTRPVKPWQFKMGKALGGLILLAGGLGTVFVFLSLTVHFMSGIGLTPADFGRVALVWIVSVLYAYSFFLLSFICALWLKKLPTAFLLSFSMWLMLVLVAPQIGDTLDPDNQVAGGVFRQLHISKPDQMKIMKGYASFETIRGGIEAASPTKHLERFNFAVLGIKDLYVGKPLVAILLEKKMDVLWLVLFCLSLGTVLFLLPLDFNRISKE